MAKRYTVTGEGVVSDTGPGPIRAILTANGAALSMFRQSEANAIVRDALQAGGDMWIAVFLPKRFSDYAKVLGYRVTEEYRKRKARLIVGQPIPFVFTGDAMKAALAGTWAKATAKGSGGRIVIRIPTGHAMQAKDQATLRRVPGWEIQRIAEEVERRIAATLADADITEAGRMTRGVAFVPPLRAGAATPGRVA